MNFLFLEDKGYTRILTVSRPKVHNALNKRVLLDIERAFVEIEQHKSLRCVVITGAGEKALSRVPILTS